MKIALLTKNLNPSGGNRVIMRLFDQMAESGQAELHVFVVPEPRAPIQALRHLAACKRRYGAAASVKLATRPLRPGEFDVLISTSRRTLDFVGDLGHPAHVHLLQAIEAWDTVNSAPFLEHCADRGYPGPDACVDLVRKIGLPHDLHYLERVAAAGRILTVSEYLASAVAYMGGTPDVRVSVPDWHIKRSGPAPGRSIDALFFVRGFVYNGDALAVAVADAMPQETRVTFVASPRAKREMKSLHGRAGLSVVQDPSDAALAGLLAAARVVVHPSLCNGGGSIPIEALALGCSVVASRTGWLWPAESRGPLQVVDEHDPEKYLSKAMRLPDERDDLPSA
ncbi:MAG: glycosyltransferase [Nocardioides sp.]